MSKGGGGGGSSTTVQKADPWVGLQPGLSALYSNATSNFNRGGPQYYPLDTQAPSNFNIEHSLNMGQDRALSGSQPLREAQASNQYAASGGMLSGNPSNSTFDTFRQGGMIGSDPAHGYFNDAMSGKYLNEQNPYLGELYKSATDPMVEQFKNATMPGLASQFSAAGRMGSGSHLQAAEGAGNSLARGLGSASASIYGNAYENERNRQQGAAQSMNDTDFAQRQQQLSAASARAGTHNFERTLQDQAISRAPGLAAGDYGDIEKLMGMGQFQQGQDQQGIDANRARYDYYQNLPNQNLGQLNQILQGGMQLNGSSASSNQSQNRNPFAGALGGASTAYGIGSMLGGGVGSAMMGPLGLLGGGLLGGLFG